MLSHHHSVFFGMTHLLRLCYQLVYSAFVDYELSSSNRLILGQLLLLSIIVCYLDCICLNTEMCYIFMTFIPSDSTPDWKPRRAISWSSISNTSRCPASSRGKAAKWTRRRCVARSTSLASNRLSNVIWNWKSWKRSPKSVSIFIRTRPIYLYHNLTRTILLLCVFREQ